MSGYSWEEIHSFQSSGEYRRFVQWLEAQLRDGQCEELESDEKSFDGWRDRWFRCKLTGAVWKLTCPDPGYFSGTWLPASEYEG